MCVGAPPTNDAGMSQFELGCRNMYKTLTLLNLIIQIFDGCMGQFLFQHAPP